MVKPFFSVIIPSLNEEKYLPNLLKDFAKQTEKNFEVILVDGKSEDKTCQLAKKFTKQCNLKILVSKKRNLAYQRNLGGQEASGAYLFFLDADMRINKNFMKRLKQKVEKYKYLLYLPHCKPENPTYKDEIITNIQKVIVKVSNLTEKPFAFGPSMVFYKELFQFLGGFDESVFVYEDHEIIQRARKRGVQAKLLAELAVYFSLRRFEKEGRLSVLGKYFIAATHFLTKGKVDKKLFEYEMGGRAKYLLRDKKVNTLEKILLKQVENFKKILEE